MQRVDSSATIQALVSNLADTSIDNKQRQTQVNAQLDAFIGTGSEDQAIAASHRLFNRALQLPPDWNAMRSCVARYLVSDLQKRSPKAAYAAWVAEQLNYDALLKDGFQRGEAGLKDITPPDVYAQAQQAVTDSVDAVCVNPYLGYLYAESLTPECLKSFVDAGGLEEADIERHAQTVLERFVPIFERLRAGQPVDLPPPTPEEAPILARAERFIEVSKGRMDELLLTVPEELRADARLFVLRGIAEAATPEQFDRLIAYYQTPAGQTYAQTMQPLIQFILQQIEAQMRARNPLALA